jgi:ABC-type sulfate/molybdate transport systems ATPase subunit
MEIRFDDVEFGYGEPSSLRIPELEVQGGRVTAVLGPNGAGKTTLLRLVAGLDQPRVGRVTVGRARPGPRQRTTAFVFQEHVFLRRSVRENLELGLRLRGEPRGEARLHALAALETVGIRHLADRRADQISGGEARRANLARAMCLRAPVLLLDEPLAGLDGKTYAQLLDDLPTLLRESGAETTLLVTHDRDEAFRLADDLVVLVDGRVLASGTKQDVAVNPRSRQVAEVLGYTILEVAGQHVAVPPEYLRVGSTRPTFTAEVEAINDAIAIWDVVLRVGTARIHLAVPRAHVPPVRGERLELTAHAIYQIEP